MSKACVDPFSELRESVEVRTSLWDMTPRDHRQSQREFRQRQDRSAPSSSSSGATVLGLSLRIQAGQHEVQPVALLTRSRVWADRRVRPPRARCTSAGSVSRRSLTSRRPAAGVAADPARRGARRSIFVVGAFAVRESPGSPTRSATCSSTPQRGPRCSCWLVTVVNGIAEELFFRGAMYAAIAAAPGGGDHDRPTRWRRWPPAT